MDRVQVFDNCRAVIHTFFAKGDNHVFTEDEREHVKHASAMVRDFIRVVSKNTYSKRDFKLVEHIRNVLHDLHTKTDYSLRGTIIRDLAELLITLERLQQGLKRSDQQKYFDAKCMCDGFVHEFKHSA